MVAVEVREESAERLLNFAGRAPEKENQDVYVDANQQDILGLLDRLGLEWVLQLDGEGGAALLLLDLGL